MSAGAAGAERFASSCCPSIDAVQRDGRQRGSVAGYYIPEARGADAGRHAPSRRINDVRSARDEPRTSIRRASCSTNIPTISSSSISRPPIRPGTARASPNSGARPRILPGDVVEVGAPAEHRFSDLPGARLAAARPPVRAPTIMRKSAAPTSSCSMRRAGCSSATCSSIPSASASPGYLRLINDGTAVR